MQIAVNPSLIYACSISRPREGAFSIYGGIRGSFAKNVLKHMPYGSDYVMIFDPDEHTLTIKSLGQQL